jgi:hypothetical protein
MFSRRTILVFAALAAAGVAGAQSLGHKIDLPKDSPVTVLSADFSDSVATPRGGAYQVDVRASLSLRNASGKRIRGVVLAVYANEVTPGGKGSVSLPLLDVAPGDAFPVAIRVPLLRPLGGTAGVSVEVKLDGVLFDDLTFYGPDTLHSQRSMRLWELQARRDRAYFKSLLASGGSSALRNEMLASLARQEDQRKPGVQMARGRVTNFDAARQVQFAFLDLPGAPVEPLEGQASVAANQARAPRITIRNRSSRPVSHLEIGWLVKDRRGREFLAASMGADLKLAPDQTGEVTQNAALRFNEPVDIESMTGFVSSVEFTGGKYWIPELDDPRLRDTLPPSPEEQRLLQIYSKKGLDALIEELKKF